MKIQTINPATEETLDSYECLSESLINKKIESGHEAYLSWKKTSFSQRQGLMLQLARVLKERRDELALLMSQEMGKPITAGKAEIDKCAWVCEHYAEHAETYLAPRFIQTEMKKAKVCYNPLGIVFAIMPWNFPFWQVFRFAAPTIMAGNAALLKHAPISSGTGNKIEQLFIEAGFPAHLFQHLIVDNEGAAKVIEHRHISAVTLTGSERAGSIVAAHAGKFLKKSVLELGGSDPYLVLEDADLDLAAHCVVTSRLNNSGQVCIAAKRIIAPKSIEQELIDKIIHHMTPFKMGDPQDPKINLGPLARKDLRDTLHEQVEKSVKQGAKLLCGGIIPSGKGFYYPPTLLTHVKPGMTAFEEELFGPVIAVSFVDDEKEAIAYANKSQYGLGAAVFTRDLKKGEYIATHEIEAGVCFVNSFVASDPRLPFGGIKHSGYGRELSEEGILEFVNTKTIAISDS
ncbi:NAD-dependent succinate-semialdehyde dehydrogenase [Legionella maioricensis]|uniref:NAD-dependent succinate-semialdehyde dehydrogenase n=1 Tax=Legionella maioricensis TaxID=2896528 RepID=A0A9X2D3H8_9GAMM|nr:NAD-dependent succinate-semialdehyde dehydrogenase [Legionella maioricensis]MCL9685577.1 NAD-dependent succinate-semialdehyde dehydrogenase [Legionella maioricensis]MCL9688920.1 NAD-dependent succinate-semialdehyde dehydrogenase [Legionella maioricensis]